MKKTLTVILTIAIIVSVSAYIIHSKKNTENMQATEKNAQQTEDDSVDAMLDLFSKDIYIVKEYNQKIGVFRTGAGKPFRIIETFVFTLPQADIKLLSTGFTVYEDELTSIVEDYTG